MLTRLIMLKMPLQNILLLLSWGGRMRHYIKRCPECGSVNLYFDKERGEIICKDCGFVIDDKMVDFEQEWREFEDSDVSERRAGAPMTYTQFDQGLGTDIGRKSNLSSLSGKSKDKYFRLRKWQYRISTAIERNLKLALAELKRVASYLKLPRSVEKETTIPSITGFPYRSSMVAIIGDIAHSRVARSNAVGFIKLGAEVVMCGPATMIPKEIESLGVSVAENIENAVCGADVIMMLRIQKERQKGFLFPTEREYSKIFGLTGKKLENAKDDVLIMHPGPVNRGLELAHDVMDGPYSVILDQVTNGVAVRMAVLYLTAGGVRNADAD